jgi:hypothetical protein
MALDLFAGITSERLRGGEAVVRAAIAIYRDTDGNEIGFGGRPPDQVPPRAT